MEFTDSGFYIAIAGPSFIPWALGMVFGASIVPVSLGIALLIESVRGRNLRASQEDEPEHVQGSVTEPRAIQRVDLRNKVAIVALIIPAAVLFAMSIFAYYWVWTLFGVSTVVCAMLWLRLRRDGVQYAEVYAIAAWMLPRLAWGVFVLVRAAVTGDDLYDFFLQEPSESGSMLSDLFGGPLLFAVVLAASGWAVGIAVTAALRDDVHMRPLAIISLAIPCVVYFWFVEPFGFAHAGFTLMVVGYAISREMRRISASPGDASVSGTMDASTQKPGSIASSQLTRLDAVLICIAVAAAVSGLALIQGLDGTNPEVIAIVGWVIIGTAAAAGTAFVFARQRHEIAPTVSMMIVIPSIAFSVLVRDVPRLLDTDFWIDNSFNFLLFVLIQVLVAGSAGIAVMLTVWLKGVHLRYGAVALGVGALAMLAWAFNVAHFDTELIAWTFTQWFGATIVVSVAIWAMWHVFGPGAVIHSVAGRGNPT